MRISVVIAAIVTTVAVSAFWNRAMAQQQSPQVTCAGKNVAIFTSTDRSPLTVKRDGAEVFKMQVVPGLIVTVCYDRLGADGELTGDITIRTDSVGGAARLRMTIDDAAVIR